jgi:hypothetical protein
VVHAQGYFMHMAYCRIAASTYHNHTQRCLVWGVLCRLGHGRHQLIGRKKHHGF